MVVRDSCPAIFRSTWTGTPASAIQVSPVCPQVVPRQAFVAERGDHLVPVGGVAQDGRADSAAARADEQPAVG